MTEITRIGVDIAKNVFEVHAVNAQEQVVVRRSLRRNQVLAWFGKLPPCLIGMEACGTATYWARELSARHSPSDPAGLCQSLCPTEQNDAMPGRSVRR